MTALCPCCGQAVRANDVLLDYASNRLTHNGITIYGTANQIDLLGLLLMRSPRVATHDDIIKAIWGDSDPLNADKCVQVMVCELRKKLTPETGLRIETVYRRGYRLMKIDVDTRANLPSADRLGATA